MFYLVQENTFTEPHYKKLIETFVSLKLDYEVCKYRPFIGEVEFTTDRRDVFCFGAYSMANTSEKYGFKPGMLGNSNHDFEVYGPKYGDYMLNSDAIVLNCGDPLPEGEEWDYFFVRPTKDTKMFSGSCYSREKWNKYIETVITNNALDVLEEQSKIMICKPKDIKQEIRCWVVGGKVVTISQYMIGSLVKYKNLDHDDEAIQFAQKMVDIYQPARAFVIDICRTDFGFKIVEINCINGCGFYHMNSEKLLLAIEDEFNKDSIFGF